MVESHYFEKERVEQTCVMNILLVTYVTHRQPHGTGPTSHLLPPPPTHLFPLSFSTPAASAHANPLQHHLYPLFKGWGQFCVSSLQRPPLGSEMPEWGESPVPSVPAEPSLLSPGLTLSGLAPNVATSSSSSAGSSIIE